MVQEREAWIEDHFKKMHATVQSAVEKAEDITRKEINKVSWAFGNTPTTPQQHPSNIIWSVTWGSLGVGAA